MVANGTTVVMEGVRITFRNFRGEERKYNKPGEKNFAVFLDQEVAERMESDEWNVKWLEPLEDDEEGQRQAFLPVSLKYDAGRPPSVVLITSRGKNHLGESEVELLDWADIINVDMIIRAYTWDVNGKQGVKAYLKSIYVTIEEDELERKYAEMGPQ